ncbi:hypothetical protein ANN_19520 [Periplaneta americana]|uniref:Uncharacterized protein n=1 Tax=Periplaneta americana TaxID=6978 RepID=A0ABQ8SB63_PERAM|nr:hypothetical protein ANN_19520 [Periplaneta americana]
MASLFEGGNVPPCSLKAICILEWLGHVIRMNDQIILKKILNTKPEGRRNIGRQKLRWLDGVEEDLRTLGVRRRRQKALVGQEWTKILRRPRLDYKGRSAKEEEEEEVKISHWQLFFHSRSVTMFSRTFLQELVSYPSNGIGQSCQARPLVAAATGLPQARTQGISWPELLAQCFGRGRRKKLKKILRLNS